jgi:uncharacterized protein DUF3303
MLFAILDKVRHGHNFERNFGAAEGLLNAFGKWKPEEGLAIHGFVSNLMGDGGYVLVEAEDPKVIVSFVSKFSYWNDEEVVPVIGVSEVTEVAGGSLAWARAASRG